jgi:hypothetical protein
VIFGGRSNENPEASLVSLCIELLIFQASPVALGVEIKVGDTRATVLQNLGEPTGKSAFASEETYFYKNGSVDLKNSTVVRSSLLTQEQMDKKAIERQMTKQQEEQRAREAEAERMRLVEEEKRRQQAFSEMRARQVEEEARQAMVLRQQEEARLVDELQRSVLCTMEAYINENKIDKVQAEAIRVDFMKGVQDRKISSSIVGVWFADPDKWLSRDSSYRSIRDFDVKQPVVQCLLVALRNHEVRLELARQQGEIEKIEKESEWRQTID